MQIIKTKNNLDILVDVDDYEKYGHLSWQLNSVGYARRTAHCTKNKCGQKTVLMHRVIMGVTDPKILIDHINGNKLDNRKCNLRLCTQSQNQFNRNKKQKTTSNYKGVYYDKRWNFRHRPWVAEIKINGRKKFLGYFKTQQEAGEKYKEIAKLVHGQFYKEIT